MIDVLVVGSGGAGLTAALHAKYEGANVTVLSKTYPTHSQTCQAQGGINAVLENAKEDSVKQHIEDTFKASKNLSSLKNIEIMCSQAKESITWLNEIGVPFSRNSEDNISQRKFGGTKNIRTCYSSDYTGLKILHTLYDQCIKESIHFINESMLLNLIVEENTVEGITSLNIKSGEVEEYRAKTVVLATGGYCNIYNNFTTNSNSTTGDGIAAALRAGAKLSNMEYIQFHPTAMEGNNILISESARAEGAYLVDNEGNRFVDELSTRDKVARAIHDKLEEGKKVYLDLTHIDETILKETIPQEIRLAKEFLDIDITKELLPVNPAAHYSMGGIKTNVSCETSIKNLFACGECAQAGVHGANRLGGNSLLEIITFGKNAGKNASKEITSIQNKNIEKKSERFEIDKQFIKAVFTFSNQIDFYEKKEFMGKMFFKNIGLYRTDMHMKEVLQQIRQWQKELTFMGIGDKSLYYNKNLLEFIEFRNMLELSEVVTVSAINRCESRGAHYRIDYPREHHSYEKETISYKVDGVLAVDFEEIQ